MAIFIVRVQLTREDPAQYTILRDKLLSAGFTKRIKSQAGVEYRLPNGNYLAQTTDSLDKVYDVVRSIAITVDRNSMILVTQATEKGNTWSGLERC